MNSVHFCVAQRLADSLRPLSSDLDEALEVFAPSHDFFSSRVRRQKLGLRTWDAEADGRGDVATNESLNQVKDVPSMLKLKMTYSDSHAPI